MLWASPIAWVVIIGMLLGGGYWLVNRIGDYREEQVWAKIRAAIDVTNEETAKQNVVDDRVAAIQEAARQKALAGTGGLVEKCLVSARVANSLSEVK